MSISGKKPSSDLGAKRNPDVNTLLEELKTGKDEHQFWENVSAIGGEPLIQEQENGQYTVTFLYRAKDAEKVELDSEDLHERILDKNDEPKCFERIPGTDTFILQIDNLPADAFCFYNIKVNGEVIHPEKDSEKSLSLQTIDIPTSKEYQRVKSVSHETRYLQLPEASIPSWTAISPNPTTHGEIRKDNFKDPTNTFVDRDIWVYEPEGFDRKNGTGKVIFMLDGENFLKSLIPYIDTISQDETNPLANTAIVFVNSKMTDSEKYGKKDLPDRVYEFYFERDRFSKFLTDHVIPKYREELMGDKPNPDNVILAAHSLAAYPIIDAAKHRSDMLGSIILLSPALNQNQEKDLPSEPSARLSKLPIYVQIGQLESAIPPEVTQNPDPENKKFRDMSAKSRLEANQDFHNTLKANKYTVQSSLRVHSSGHGGIHAVEGLAEGVRFVNSCRKEKRVLSEHETEQQPVKTLVKQYQTYIDQDKQEKLNGKKNQQTDIRDTQENKTQSRPK